MLCAPPLKSNNDTKTNVVKTKKILFLKKKASEKNASLLKTFRREFSDPQEKTTLPHSNKP